MDGLRERDNQELRVANAETRETADPDRQKQREQRKTRRKRKFTARKRIEFAAIKTMVYRKMTMRTPPYVRGHAKKNSNSRTIPSGCDHPPVHAAEDNQAEMRFARGAASSGTEPAGANRG